MIAAAATFAVVLSAFAPSLSAATAARSHAPGPAQPAATPRVDIEPAESTVFAGAALRFHARVVGGTSTRSGVRWDAFGAGTIDDGGLYRAPLSPGAAASIVATIGAIAGGTRVNIARPPPPGAGQAIVACYADGALDVRGAYDAPGFGRLAIGDAAAGVAVDERASFVVAATGDRLAVIDLSTMIASSSAPLTGARLGEVALLADGAFAAATNANAGSGGKGIAVFRLHRGSNPKLASTAAAGETPEGIAVDADGRTMYVSGVNSNVVTRLELQADGSLRKTGSARTATRPFGVAVDSRHHLLFVADNDTPTLSGSQSRPGLETFSLPALRRVAPPLTTGSPNALPLGVAVDSSSDKLFVTNEGDDNVAVFALPSLRRLTTLRVGRTPWLPSVDIRRHLLYVPNARDNTLDIFDTRTLAHVAAGISTCSYPVGVAVRPRKASY